MIKLLLKNGADPRIEAQGEAPIVNASGEAKDVLAQWDIAETERLLQAYQQRQEAVQKAAADAQTRKTRAMEGVVAQAEKSDEAAQKVLQCARCALERRIHEYDVCVRDGRDALQATALSCVKAAERELAEAKERADLAREALLAAKATLRGPEDARAAEQRPGVHVDYADVGELVWNDVHKRIAKAEKWAFVIDPTLRTQTFLKYRDIVYVNTLTQKDMEPERLRTALLGGLRYGKPVVIDMMDVDMVRELRQQFEAVDPNAFEWLMSTHALKEGAYLKLIRPSDPDAYQGTYEPAMLSAFRVIFLTSYSDPNEDFLGVTYPVWITPDLDEDEDGGDAA